MVEIPPTAEELDICTNPRTLEEVKTAIKAMKSENTGGVDGVTSEMLKDEETKTSGILTNIFKEIWESDP